MRSKTADELHNAGGVTDMHLLNFLCHGLFQFQVRGQWTQLGGLPVAGHPYLKTPLISNGTNEIV